MKVGETATPLRKIVYARTGTVSAARSGAVSTSNAAKAPSSCRCSGALSFNPPMSTPTTGSDRVKRGLAEMLKGGVIMDVVTPEQAKIAACFAAFVTPGDNGTQS